MSRVANSQSATATNITCKQSMTNFKSNFAYFQAARKCWATPVSDSDYKVFYPLIDDYCVKNGALGGKLVILENGESKTARFEGPVFRFVKHTEVWLHCELKVCFGDSCDTVCQNIFKSR